MLIVAVSTAIFESAKNGQTAAAPEDVRTEQVVGNMLANKSGEPSEPLSELGVTPGPAPTPPAADPSTPAL
jgi:hypothetical protein